MIQDGPNMFSSHCSKTVDIMHIVLLSSELSVCLSLEMLYVLASRRLPLTAERLPDGNTILIKQYNPFPLPSAKHSPLNLRLNDVSVSRCWGTNMMWCAPPQKCNCNTHQGYRDVWRLEKELWLTLPRWCLVLPPKTHTVLVDKGDNMQQVEERLSNFLFCSNSRHIPCFQLWPSAAFVVQ